MKIMSPGYGNKIYRNRNSPVPFIVITLVILSALVIFLLIGKGSYESGKPSPGEVSKDLSSEASPDFQRVPAGESVGHTSKPVQTEVDNAELVEEPSLFLPENVTGNQESSNLENGTVRAEARRLFVAKKFKRALELCLSISGQDKTVLVLIGQCYYYLEEYDNAYIYLERALEQGNRNFKALKFLAFTAYKTDRLNDSLSFVNEALEIIKDRELQILLNNIKKEIPVMKGYSDTRTPNFRVVFSKIEHGDIKKKVLDILNEAYRTIGKEMNYYPKSTVSVILYNEKGFFDITRAPGWAGGIYDGKIRIPIKGVRGRDGLLRRILFHEYTHAFIHSITKRCPRWINEGLAEYYSSDDRRTIGQVIPLSYLERAFPSSSAKLIITSYKESFSAVSYLIEKYGFYRLRELLEAFSRGKNIRTVFESVYYISYDHFLKTWGKV